MMIMMIMMVMMMTIFYFYFSIPLKFVPSGPIDNNPELV